MASLFNATTVNQTPRYFFATRTEGEQDLYTTVGTVAGLSTFNVGITGAGGNLVQIDTMPQVTGTEFVTGEQAVFVGTASEYLTLSTINTAATGVSISADRIGGIGTGCIEAYNGNGSSPGIEFLQRGVNSQLFSTNSVGMNSYISSIGNVGASARLSASGLITGAVTASGLTSLDNPTGVGGRACFGIQDLSGVAGVTPLARWALGTTTVPTGGNTGSDFNIFAYNDAGNFSNSPMTIRRSDGAMRIANISSASTTVPSGGSASVFPASKTNVEFGAPTGTVPVGGAITQGQAYVNLFSTNLTGLNPNTQTLININFFNSLSSGTNSINYKIGFSTSTAYTNIIQTSYVPGLGATWTPSGLPGTNTPVGATNICAMLDSDGVNPDGTATLYVGGQLSNPNAPIDLLYIKKGQVTEPTRNALVWRPV